MEITSTKFVRGVVGEDEIFNDGVPQIAFIGRSNVGKSSTINSLVGKKDLTRVSVTQGRTQEINFFMINEEFYLVDLPGYGFAKLSKTDREWIQKLINWYFFNPSHKQEKVVLIIDAKVGPTKSDLEMLTALDQWKKEVLIIANKTDKIKKSQYNKQMKEIQEKIGNHELFPFSAKTKSGREELINVLFKPPKF